MDKATALLHAARGAQGDQNSLLAALRASLLGDGVATYAGNPNGNVTPANRGEWLLDTTSLIFYRATTTANSGWVTDARSHSAVVELFDDFLGDVIADQWDTQTGTSTTTAAVAITTGINGLLKISTGDSAATTLAANGIILQSSLNYQASKGGLSLEVALQPVATTANLDIFVGFTDQRAAIEMPIAIPTGGIDFTNTADDAAGFYFSNNATTPLQTLWTVGGVKATTKTALTALASGPADTVSATLRIDISTAGAASFYYNGVLQTTIASALTATVPLVPVVVMRSRTNASKAVQLDYIRIRQNR